MLYMLEHTVAIVHDICDAFGRQRSFLYATLVCLGAHTCLGTQERFGQQALACFFDKPLHRAGAKSRIREVLYMFLEFVCIHFKSYAVFRDTILHLGELELCNSEQMIRGERIEDEKVVESVDEFEAECVRENGKYLLFYKSFFVHRCSRFVRLQDLGDTCVRCGHNDHVTCIDRIILSGCQTAFVEYLEEDIE